MSYNFCCFGAPPSFPSPFFFLNSHLPPSNAAHVMSPEQGCTGALLECINLRDYYGGVAQDAETISSYVVALA